MFVVAVNLLLLRCKELSESVKFLLGITWNDR